MFRRKRYHRRSTPIPFVIFRMLLSLTMFAVLAFGIYTAYRQFSGFDPLGADPKRVLTELIAGIDSGKLIAKIPILKHSENATILGSSDSKSTSSNKKALFKFMLVADSHNDNEDLAKAFKEEQDAKFVVGLGDFTEVGTLGELQAAKKEFDKSGLRYFVTPGDHDLWDSRDKGHLATDNFVKVFGPPYQSFSYGNVRFLVIYNADNYNGLGTEQMGWLGDELSRIKNEDSGKILIAMVHEPLYHPSSDHMMGKITPALTNQARSLIRQLADAGVKEIFAGDTHFFSQYQDPVSNISMATIGAITADRNLQTPRYGEVTVFDDGSLGVEDLEIK